MENVMKFEPKTLDFNLSPYTGLIRSFFIAAPMIHENQELVICGYNIIPFGHSTCMDLFGIFGMAMKISRNWQNGLRSSPIV